MDGLGVMINRLGGNIKTLESYDKSRGKIISVIELEDNTITLSFSDGSFLYITDEGQSCCEYRYITTDDDLSKATGAKLGDITLLEAPESAYEHEVQFLNIVTDKGVIVFETHNEHNGYYGGFSITLRYKDAPQLKGV